ncbi:MAG: SpoIIE family protein phosphatase [Roseinatronobacter sp.]
MTLHPTTPDLFLPIGQKNALIVDDSRAQRMVFTRQLQVLGYQTTEAGSGEEALALCERAHFDLILSDWMMPGMSGLDFCRNLRASASKRYSYFILMTSKNDKEAVAEGLDVGADDFLSKPVAALELRARINAGERLLSMERALRARNDDLRETMRELQRVHDALDRDLQQARKLQHSLIRDRHRDLGSCQVSFLLQSSGHVGGDLVGAFQISETRLGVYSIDVSGHGVAAAMLCARVGALFAEGAEGQNIAFNRDSRLGEDLVHSPDQVAMRLNDLLLRELDTDTYLTLCYADVDLSSGHVTLVQAGHPHPLVQRRDGRVDYLGDGGLPVGLVPNASYVSFKTRLEPGDRLLLYSDGITECTNSKEEELGNSGFEAILKALTDVNGPRFLDALKWDLAQWAEREEFDDDVSAVVLEFRDYKQPQILPRTRYYRGMAVLAKS